MLNDNKSKVLGLAMQGLMLGKGMIQAIVGAILDIVLPMIPPPRLTACVRSKARAPFTVVVTGGFQLVV